MNRLSLQIEKVNQILTMHMCEKRIDDIPINNILNDVGQILRLLPIECEFIKDAIDINTIRNQIITESVIDDITSTIFEWNFIVKQANGAIPTIDDESLIHSQKQIMIVNLLMGHTPHASRKSTQYITNLYNKHHPKSTIESIINNHVHDIDIKMLPLEMIRKLTNDILTDVD